MLQVVDLKVCFNEGDIEMVSKPCQDYFNCQNMWHTENNLKSLFKIRKQKITIEFSKKYENRVIPTKSELFFYHRLPGVNPIVSKRLN